MHKLRIAFGLTLVLFVIVIGVSIVTIINLRNKLENSEQYRSRLETELHNVLFTKYLKSDCGINIVGPNHRITNEDLVCERQLYIKVVQEVTNVVKK